jgi:hypothetical protein
VTAERSVIHAVTNLDLKYGGLDSVARLEEQTFRPIEKRKAN